MEPKILNIREYQEEDKKVVLKFIEALQDFELNLEADRAKGETITEPYLEYILHNCSEKNGKIFVVDYEKETVGFGCIWIEEDLNPISNIQKCGYISDLFVELRFREKNIGQALVEVMENYARQLGIHVVQLNTLANNGVMQKFAEKCKYRQSELTYSKEV